jgi:hypothetical protein
VLAGVQGALKSETPSTPRMTASPSSTNRFCRTLRAALSDPRVALGPVVTAPGDQADAVAVAFQAEAIAVVLDFVEPVRTNRDAGRFGGDAELK